MGALVALAGTARADARPRVALYTIGPGDTMFSRFGHAAVCVLDGSASTGRCYNYGTANFSTPRPLTWNMLRGRALFWLSVSDHDAMVQRYRVHDRTVYRQWLPLSPEQTVEMLRRLAADAAPEPTHYLYRHFHDNCSTRPRDLIDQVLPGRLRSASSGAASVSFRRLLRQDLAGDWPILALSELILGRPADLPRSRFEAMFLPRVLRREVEQHLGAIPEVLYRRQGPAPGGDPLHGVQILVVLAAILGIVSSAAIWWGGPHLRRLGLAVPAAVASLAGLAVIAGPLISPLPELRLNELLVVLLPTDIALVWLSRPGRRGMLAVRSIMVLAAVALSATGWLVQPVLGPVLLAGAVLVPGWLSVVRSAHQR